MKARSLRTLLKTIPDCDAVIWTLSFNYDDLWPHAHQRVLDVHAIFNAEQPQYNPLLRKVNGNRKLTVDESKRKSKTLVEIEEGTPLFERRAVPISPR
jgi:hypothetical protein